MKKGYEKGKGKRGKEEKEKRWKEGMRRKQSTPRGKGGNEEVKNGGASQPDDIIVIY